MLTVRVQIVTVSLDELSEILEKQQKWRDIGGLKENTRAATIMKIIFALAKEPSTKEGIHRATGIHKNVVLPTALHVAIRRNLIFERKPKAKYYSLDDPLKTKAYGYTYYLLNWSHPDSREYFLIYRDHIGQKDTWGGRYYSEENILNERDRRLMESEHDYEARLRELNNFDRGIFERISVDTIAVIKRRKQELESEWPEQFRPKWLKDIILDQLIHLKIQGIIPNDTYPNGALYTYLDVWEALEKEGLIHS